MDRIIFLAFPSALALCDFSVAAGVRRDTMKRMRVMRAGLFGLFGLAGLWSGCVPSAGPSGGMLASSADAGVASPSDGGPTSYDGGPIDGVDASPVDTGPPRPDMGLIPPNGGRGQTPNGVRHIYSQLQAWSSEGQYFLAVDINSAEGVVFHAGTWEEQARLSRVGHRWITGTHSVLMFDDQTNGAALYAYDVDSGMETELLQLGHPGLRAGRSHEEMDRAGRWVAVYIDEPNGGGSPRIITADVVMQRVAADIAITDISCDFEPDWISVDPTGRFLLVQSVRDGRGPCSGLWAHDIETGAPLHQLTENRNHGSTGVSPTGRPYFLTTDLTHPDDNGSPGIYRHWIDTGEREVVGAPLPWGALEHISCLGPPGGACFASASNDFGTEYSGQLWKLDYDGNRTILEPHNASGCDYWGQAHATVGPGERFAYATHSGNCAEIRSVVVQ